MKAKSIKPFGTKKETPVGGEPVIGASMADNIEETFLNNLGATSKSLINTHPSSAAGSKLKVEKKDYNTEKMLTSLYEVYDGLMEVFDKTSFGEQTSKILGDVIGKTSECINMAGGEVDDFSPIDHVSGLRTPSNSRNINMVIETTKNLYSRATIEKIEVSSGGLGIDIVVAGLDSPSNTMYRAFGTIRSSVWDGNEAIDYIYTPAAGKMSVKVLSNNKWVEKDDKFKIEWDLQELPLNTASEKDIEMFRKNITEEKETDTLVEKEIDEIEVEEGLEFPIEEKS